MLESVTDWFLSLDTHHSIDAIYFDFRKAFDSVSHSKLLIKLRAYGISGLLLNWLTSFLSDRTQFVAVDGALSDISRVTSGVPQGSVLGPTLFLVFINDICDIKYGLDVVFKLFADDLKIYSICDGFCHSSDLVAALSRIEAWSILWQLPLASEKCQIVHFGRHLNCIAAPPPTNYFLFQSPIMSVLPVKDLGILIDDQLKFDSHISSIVNKALTRSRLIFRCFSSGNRALLLKAYITYVRPILEYGNVVWSPRFGYLIDRIESVQRYFTKRIPGLWSLPYATRLSMLGLQTLAFRRSISDLIICYKIVHGLIDTPLVEYFQRKQILLTRGHDLRLTIPSFNMDIAKYSFPVRTIRLWNSLPSEVVHASSISSFARGLNSLSLNVVI